MPFEDMQQQTDSLSALSAMPAQEGAMEGAAIGADVGAGMGAELGAEQQLGGPGVDTPQEQQAVQMLMQGAQMFRQAADTDPSVRHLIDKFLQDGFLQISEHYGFGEEGKLALKQAQMTKGRAQASAVSGQGPQMGPPVGGPPMA